MGDPLHTAGTTQRDAVPGLQTRTALIGATKIRYGVQGKGEPLVLVHGLAGSTACWARNADALSRHYTVYLVDLPGFGAMRQYRRHFSLPQAAEWLEHLLTALNLGKVSLVGHSMGGLIAAMFAARSPDRLAKLVLAAPAIGLSQTAVPAFLLPLARHSLSVNPRFLPTLARDAARAGPFTVLRATRELLAMNIERELAQIASPCLLVWGQRDPLVPVALSGPLKARIRDSRLCILPNAGHVVMYDRPDQFNRAVLAFLAEPPSEAKARS